MILCAAITCNRIFNKHYAHRRFLTRFRMHGVLFHIKVSHALFFIALFEIAVFILTERAFHFCVFLHMYLILLNSGCFIINALNVFHRYIKRLRHGVIVGHFNSEPIIRSILNIHIIPMTIFSW